MRKQFFLKSIFGCVLGLSLFFFKQASADELSLSSWALSYLLLEDLDDTIKDLAAEQKDVVCVETSPGKISEAIYDALIAHYPYLISLEPSSDEKQWFIASKYPIEENLAEESFSIFSIQGAKKPFAYLCLAKTQENSPSELHRIVDTIDNLLEESEASCLFAGKYHTVRSLENIYREKIATVLVPFVGGFCAIRVSPEDERLLPLQFQKDFGSYFGQLIAQADTNEANKEQKPEQQPKPEPRWEGEFIGGVGVGTEKVEARGSVVFSKENKKGKEVVVECEAEASVNKSGEVDCKAGAKFRIPFM